MPRSLSLVALLALGACQTPADLGPIEADVERLESSLAAATVERTALTERVSALESQLGEANATIARLESAAATPAPEEVEAEPPRPSTRRAPPIGRDGVDAQTRRDLTIPEIFR